MFALVPLLALHSAAPAADPAVAVDGAAIDAGKAIAAAGGCSACHGQSWRGGAMVPRVAGQVPS
jgi:cytochrome c553